MTLGDHGGTVNPLTRAEVLALPPVIGLPLLGRAFAVSELVSRDRQRRGEWEAMGIRVLRLGVQYRVVTADLWRVLGLSDSPTAGASQKAPAVTTAEPSPEGNDYGQRTAGT